MKVADRVISYLYHTRTLRKTFNCKKPLVDEIMALVDSNWASSWDAKSTSSGVIMGNGAALVSLVKLQKLPAHSSCEAELIAMDDIVREIAFMLNLMKEFGMKLKKPLVIWRIISQQYRCVTTKFKISVQSILMFGIFTFGI